MIAIYKRDRLLVETGVNQKEQADSKRHALALRPYLAHHRPDKEARHPAPEQCQDLPGKRLLRKDTREHLVDQSPGRPVGGEVTRQRIRPQLVANPTDRQIVPVEPQLWDEQAIGQHRYEQEQCSGAQAFHEKQVSNWSDWSKRSGNLAGLTGHLRPIRPARQFRL